ncbi:hypothetical protein Ancab_010597 [Ancistrocladus abbreviatus]
MTEHKRSPSSVEQQTLTYVASKRQKADLSMSPKDRKEKFGERIVALQQLVSPYGKTDTASVLLEAMEYIGFLHEQVKVLSAPYLHTQPISEMGGSQQYGLKNRGLCLVPVSCTVGLACSSNGADIWAPIKSSSPGFSYMSILQDDDNVLWNEFAMADLIPTNAASSSVRSQSRILL